MDKISKLKNNLYKCNRVANIIDLIIILGEIVRIILYRNDVISNEASLIWAIGSLSGVVLCLLTVMIVSISVNYQLINITNERVEELLKKIENSEDNKE